jgi:zinc carboxypeptidase
VKRTILSPILGLSLGVVLWTGSATAAESSGAAEVRERLASMARPWTERAHRITQEEYEGTLKYWAETHPSTATLEQIDTSVRGMGIFLLKITDAAVPDEDKQVCLCTSLHGGPERSGTTTLMHLIEWLLSDAPAAIETRRRQVVLVMPIVNPESFFLTDRFTNTHGIDPYTGTGNWDLATLTYKALDKSPEIRAFLKVVDQYHPEVHADLHGIGLQEIPEDKLGDRTMPCGQTMFEVTGSAYSSYALRPWDWRVTEAMIAAGVAAGAGSDRFEADAQRGFWGPAMNPIADRFWLGRPNFYTSQYAYAKYHTMVMTHEIGYESCGVARMQGLLNIGNTVWDGESVRGYPVDRVKSFCGHFVTAWGQAAQDRRESRIALWNGQGGTAQAMLYPQMDGRDTYIYAATPAARKLLDPDPDAFLKNCAGLDGFDVEAVRAFVDEGPEIKLVIDAPGQQPGDATAWLGKGIGFRLRIPYRNPKLLDVRLNGHALTESPVDGYQAWYGNGFTQVQVNVPPEKAPATELFTITCAYLPDEKRTFGWTPPQAVLDRLK